MYKDKNMKLYNLVLQLEKVSYLEIPHYFIQKEKQELIDKNIQMLEEKQQQQSKPQREEMHL